MRKKIFLNATQFKFDESYLPILIHGVQGAGASLLTVSLIAQLYSNGSKILFFSGYEMAKDEFISQVENIDSSRITFVKTDREADLIKEIANIKNLDERVILIKNVELLSHEVFTIIEKLSKLVISGNIEKCLFKADLLRFPFKTSILFSPLFDKNLLNLHKYGGYMWGRKEGYIRVNSRT